MSISARRETNRTGDETQHVSSPIGQLVNKEKHIVRDSLDENLVFPSHDTTGQTSTSHSTCFAVRPAWASDRSADHFLLQTRTHA